MKYIGLVFLVILSLHFCDSQKEKFNNCTPETFDDICLDFSFSSFSISNSRAYLNSRTNCSFITTYVSEEMILSHLSTFFSDKLSVNNGEHYEALAYIFHPTYFENRFDGVIDLEDILGFVSYSKTNGSKDYLLQSFAINNHQLKDDCAILYKSEQIVVNDLYDIAECLIDKQEADFLFAFNSFHRAVFTK